MDQNALYVGLARQRPDSFEQTFELRRCPQKGSAMARGEKPGPADRTGHRSSSSWLVKIEEELESIVERMEAEIADRRILTEKSASDLHELRIAAERFAETEEYAG